MRVDIAPPFPLPGYWSDRACAEVVYEFDGQRYYLKQMDKHMLYRTAERNSPEYTLYVPCQARPDTPANLLNENESARAPTVYPEDVFREQVRAGLNGRVAMYACPQARDCVAALFFSPDGMGKFLDYYTANSYMAHKLEESLYFLWKGGRHGIANRADVLTCDWQTLLPLCEDVFKHQVWPRMEDPFVSYAETNDEPASFTCGSCEELQHITRCICHADATLFADAEDTRRAAVTYHARTSRQQGGLQERPRFGYRSPASLFATELCTLTFVHNTFQGGSWNFNGYGVHSRRESYYLRPAVIMIDAAPPSAHERAEALLTLYDWLEGKVTESERRRLLRLDAPAVTTDGKR